MKSRRLVWLILFVSVAVGGTKHIYEGKLYYQEHLKEEDVEITDRFPDDET